MLKTVIAMNVDAVACAPDSVTVLLDSHSRILHFTSPAANFLGLYPEAYGQSADFFLTQFHNEQGLLRELELACQHQISKSIQIESRAGQRYEMQILVHAAPQFCLAVSFVDLKLEQQRAAALQISEARYRSIADDLQIGILIQTANSEIVLCNRAALQLLGLTEDQLMGKTSLDPDWNVIHPDGTAFPGYQHPVPQAIASKYPVHNVEMGVYRPVTRDRVWLLVNADPQLQDDGSVQQVLCTFYDITQRKLAKEIYYQAREAQQRSAVLEERNAFTQAVLNSVEAEIAVLSRDGMIIAVNDAWRRFALENSVIPGVMPANCDVGAYYLAACKLDTGMPADKVAGVQEVRQGVKAVLDGRLSVFTHEYSCHSVTDKRWFAMSVTHLGAVDGGGAVITHTDITTRKLAEMAQQERATELAQAQYIAHIGSWHWDAESDENTVSDELCHIYGRAHIPAFAEQRGVMYEEAAWQCLNSAVQEAMRTGIGYNLELPAIHSSGAQIWINSRCDAIHDDAGRLTGLRGIVQDITDMRLNAERLKANEERLRLAIDASSDGLWDWDVPSGFIFRSPHYYQVIGANAEDDTHDFAFFKATIFPEDLPHAMATITAHQLGQTPNIEFEYRQAGQRESVKWLGVKGCVVKRDANGKPLRIVGTLSDISAKKLAQLALQEREQQLARVIKGSDQGYWDWNVQTQEFHVSERFESMLGYESGEMDVSVGNWAAYVHPDDLAAARISIENHLQGTSPSHGIEIRCRNKEGDWRWILTRGSIVTWDKGGRPLMMSGTHTDITERKNLELIQMEASTVFSSSYEGIMVVNPEQKITKVNPAFTRITGYSAEEVLGQSPQILSSGHHDAAFYQFMWTEIFSKGFWSGEIWNKRKNGEIYAELLSVSAVKNSDAQISHYVGVFSDISKFKSFEQELDRMAHYDPLTGAPNRSLLADRLEQAMLRANRTGKSLAVCFLDLDDFKMINERLSRQTGDQLLVGIAENLKLVLRADDTLARLGGDEFVLLLSDIASADDCALILERVLHAVKTPVALGEESIWISGSIGVCLYPDDDVDADTLLRHADQAMCLAKEAGKNRYHLFDLENNRKVQLHREQLTILRAAMEKQEFVLFYQPKVNLLTGEVIGAEALIRWQHPERGILPPSEFLPYIAGSDLEAPIGEWVINEALEQAERWHNIGLPLCVSANISADHLLKTGFCEQLSRALSGRPDLPAGSFELEILETSALADLDRAVYVLKQCQQLGIHFSLDDFGTGYSSLTYLRKLSVDTLKIDQSFVRGMLNNADDRGIVESVIQLGAVFQRKIIAEGVETMEHGAALLGLGCHYAQGYGIARPMPAEHFHDWTLQWEKNADWKNILPVCLVKNAGRKG